MTTKRIAVFFFSISIIMMRVQGISRNPSKLNAGNTFHIKVHQEFGRKLEYCLCEATIDDFSFSLNFISL